MHSDHSYHGMTFDLVSTPKLRFCFKCSCQSKMLHSLLMAVQTLYCSDLLPELCHFLFVCVKGASKKNETQENEVTSRLESMQVQLHRSVLCSHLLV